MAEKLNDAAEVLKKLKEASTSDVDSNVLSSVMSDVNVHMEKVVREYEIKDKHSQLSAANVLLTT